MNNILNVLAEKHATWLRYIKSFGCNEIVAEDYVQEMYIKIYNYSQRTDNDLMYNEKEVNYFFVYVTLKNMYYDDLRKNKNKIIVNIEEVQLEDDNYYTEVIFNLQSNLVDVWVSSLDSKINEIEGYNVEKASLCYIKFVYQKILIEQNSVSKLSRNVGISYWSLRNTLQIIKEQIRDGIK